MFLAPLRSKEAGELCGRKRMILGQIHVIMNRLLLGSLALQFTYVTRVIGQPRGLE